MNTAGKTEPMQRKPILMPPSMITKVDAIAKDKQVSFAEVVREAIRSFSESPTADEEFLLEKLADAMIQTTEDIAKQIDVLGKRLDETHRLL